MLKKTYLEQNLLRSNINKFRSIGINYTYLKYRAKWKLATRWPIYFKSPIHADIELSSNCNMKCIMCPHGIESSSKEFIQEIMDFDVAKKIINECAELGVSSIKFSGRGEAMMHPNIAELVKLAKSLGIIEVMINTNGLLLKNNRTESLLDAGTDLIIISIDGSTKDTYEKIRIKGNYDVVTKNVDNLIKLKKHKKLKKPLIRLQFTIMKENVDEFAEFKKQWEDKVDILVGLNYNQRGDQESKAVDNPIVTGRAYCSEPWRRMTFTSTGSVQMCCADWYNKSPVGDITKQSVSDIWNGNLLNKYKKYIENLQHDKIIACKECFVPDTYTYK